MTDLAGLLVLLGAMLLILRTMIRGRLGWSRPTKRRYERPPRHWWRAAAWIPTGYAITKLIGTGAPLSVVVMLAALLAAAHRAASGPIDLAAGGLGTAISIMQVIGSNDCRGSLGATGAVLLLVFASVTTLLMLSSAAAIGHLRPGQHAVATCTAIELALFAVSPGGVVVTGANELGVAVAATLVLATIVGLRPQLGLAALGACLMLAEVNLAFVGQLCDRSAPYALAGAVVFSATRLLLSSRRNRQLVRVR
jgi:hypothetical protein